ncbi:hypothetical protein BH23THE1_BH23THE1_22540 [soil metagenome]
MNKIILNFISVLILTLGLLFVSYGTAYTYHADYHVGPSCGECHCSSGQTCTADPLQCDCTTPTVDQQ